MTAPLPSSPDQPPVPTPAGARVSDNSRRRRWGLWLAGAGLVALLIFGLRPRAVPVEVAEVVVAPLQVTVDEEGMTRVRDRYVVSSPVAGHLRRLPVKAGARVTAGRTVVAVLEPGGADLLDARGRAQGEARVRVAESAREQAAAQLERAEAAFELVRKEADRLRALADRGVVSRQELDVAETNVRTAEQDRRSAGFALQVARHELEQAEALLLRAQPGTGGDDAVMEITSPVDGVVLRVLQESARVVPGGLPLLEVGDPEDLEVRIEVLSRDGVAVAPGARVILEQWGGGAPLEGRVRLVEPAAFTKVSALGVEEQRVNVIADLVTPVAERGGLGDGYRVEARIVRWQEDAVRQVPAGALFQQDGRWWVFAVTGGEAVRREVVPGQSDGVNTQVLSGLEEGDRVIVYPSDRIADGVAVTALQVNP